MEGQWLNVSNAAVLEPGELHVRISCHSSFVHVNSCGIRSKVKVFLPSLGEQNSPTRLRCICDREALWGGVGGTNVLFPDALF